MSARSSSRSGGGSAGAPARRPGLLGGLSGMFGPGAGGGGGGGGRAAAGGGPVEVQGNPGRTALLVSVVLAIGSGLAILFVAKAELDDRDKVLPTTGFGGLYLKARAALGGSDSVTKTSMIDAHGAAVLIWALFPAIIAVGAFVVYRQRRANGQSVYWPLTIAMVLMALSVMVGASYALPAMVAIAIAGFQVRKAEMPARVGGRAEPEAEADEDDDEYEDEEYDEDDEYEDDEYDEDEEYDEDVEEDDPARKR